MGSLNLQDGHCDAYIGPMMITPLSTPLGPATIQSTNLVSLLSTHARESNGKISQKKSLLKIGPQKGRENVNTVSFMVLIGVIA